MEQELNQGEMQHIANLKKKRAAMFDKMGVTPTFSQEETSAAANSSALASASPSARDRLNKIRDIQQGGMIKEMRHFNNADTPNDKFQEIPVNTPKRPLSAEEQQKKSQQMESMGLNKKSTVNDSHSREANMYEAMFDPDAGARASASDVVMGHAFEERRAAAMQQQQTGNLIESDNMMGNIGSWENSFRAKTAQAAPQGYQQAPQGYPQQPGMMQEGQQSVAQQIAM